MEDLEILKEWIERQMKPKPIKGDDFSEGVKWGHDCVLQKVKRMLNEKPIDKFEKWEE